jgi:hypothetical protein
MLPSSSNLKFKDMLFADSKAVAQLGVTAIY